MKIPLFYRGLIIFLVVAVPMEIIWNFETAIDIDRGSRIIIPCIIAMIPLIVAISKSDRIFPPQPRGTMPKGWNEQQNKPGVE